MNRIILICGPSGSGKTYLANKFTNYISLSTDDFYYGLNNVPLDDQGLPNFDHPEAIDLNECCDCVLKLAQRKNVEIPDYDFKISERIGKKLILAPKENGIVILEGIFSFHNKILRKVATLKIFIDPPNEICLARRYKRDIEERGREPLQILQQLGHAYKGYKKYILPMKKEADLILDFGILV